MTKAEKEMSREMNAKKWFFVICILYLKCGLLLFMDYLVQFGHSFTGKYLFDTVISFLST